jgi:OOP family OmpA-OmpF porin
MIDATRVLPRITLALLASALFHAPQRSAVAHAAKPRDKPRAQASASASVSGSGSGVAAEPPMRRHAPVPGQTEIGIYGGVLLPSKAHSFLGSGASFQRLAPVLGSLGVRFGYYPLSWLGGEAEGGGFPGKIDDGPFVQLYHVRASAVFQVPFRLAPFVVFGPGVLMVNSDVAELGTDFDPAAHVGGGFKFFANRWIALRLEWRGTLAPHRDLGTTLKPAFHNEILLGLTLTFRPKAGPAPQAPAPIPASDRDGDGFLDPSDKCPDERGVTPDGCPIPDRDGDGFRNEVDACPDEPGVSPDGCPVKDKDRDGIVDEKDDCPEGPGVEPDGCPIRDKDKDQILDPDDKCVDKPETRNGFEDTDGCPDEVPKEVQKFTGVIKGIYFDMNKATIQKRSHRVLDEAVRVLEKFPSIKLEIVGHTDSTGKDDHNRKLSQDRAESVRKYLIDKGISADRLTARGAGEDEPKAPNDTPAGRAENRRTEFNIVSE